LTHRKPILPQIKNLLLSEYYKFFNKKYYKLADPYYGKKPDVLNKMAVAALLKDNKKLAEELWEEATEEYEKHFDTILNYNLYKWRNAIITD
jgi:hypothetical protein